MSWLKSIRFKLVLKHTPLNLIGRQGITSIRGCMSRCKQRAKRRETRDESSSEGKKKKAKSRTKRSFCKINEPAGVPNASRMKVTRPLNTFPARVSPYIVCMNRHIRYSIPWTVPESRRRLASVPPYTDGTYDLSNVDTTRFAPCHLYTARLSFGLSILLGTVFRFMGILRNTNDQCHFMIFYRCKRLSCICMYVRRRSQFLPGKLQYPIRSYITCPTLSS